MASPDDIRGLLIQDIAATEGFDDLFTTLASVPLPVLGGQTLPVSLFPSDHDWDAVIGVLARMTDVSESARPEIATMALAEFREMLAMRRPDYASEAAMLAEEGADRGFETLSPPATADEIWPLMRFKEIFVDKSVDGAALNVILVAETAWDMEHQTGVFFRDGSELKAVTDPSTGV